MVLTKTAALRRGAGSRAAVSTTRRIAMDNPYLRALLDPATTAPAAAPDQSRHWKGRGGTVVVLGGSPMYAGAPRFASIAALRSGAELVYAFTERSAAAALKVAAPDVCTTAGWDGEPDSLADVPGAAALEVALARADAVVVGPGLGRARGVLDAAAVAVIAAQDRHLPVILDADALWLVAERPGLVHGHRATILTPNAIEFERLRMALAEGLHPRDVLAPPTRSPEADAAAALAEVRAVAAALGVTVLRKGPVDVVSDGGAPVEVAGGGSLKRPGGLGDVLAGCTAALACLGRPGAPTERPDTPWSPVLAAAAACELVRAATHCAHTRRGRALIASDVLHDLAEVAA